MPASSRKPAAGRDTLASDSVLVDGILFPFTFCRSRRRTIAITVHPDRSLAVRAPLRLPQSEIREFVTRKALWIIKVWARMAALPPRVERPYGEGTPVPLLGESYPLQFRQGSRRSATVCDGRLILTTPEPLTDEAIGLMIEGWYRRKAREIIPRHLATSHRLMAPEGIPLPPFTVRPMRSRWGSYSYRSGRVCLNLHLLATTAECLDYVIIHELCHIKVRHHGPDFWRLVERYCPGYHQAREELKKYRLP